jgi:hypothetical protein
MIGRALPPVKLASVLSLALFFASIAVLNVRLLGQNILGSIVGTVVDSSGGSIVGAKVTVTNTGTGERRGGSSRVDGEYEFLNLVPGIYRVEVEQNGFKKATRENVEVTISGAVRADIAMQVGDVTQNVEVQATAQLLRTENANVSQVVPTRAIEETPVNGRNLMALTTLVPGVVANGTTDGNAITGKNIFAAGNYQIGGGMANQGATFYDGVPNNSVLGNLVNMVPSPDVVSEFRVESNSNSSEYGRYSGGVINISSKSGTNGLHGAAYEYFRNTDLDANLFFNNATGIGKAPVHQNQYGADAGGPIKKNKLFGFFGWENYYGRQGANYLGTVPLPAMYNGDFSGYRNASNAIIPIYDPLTQCGTNSNSPCPGGVAAQSYSAGPARNPFPGNIIPINRFNPTGLAILNFPITGKPNVPGVQYTAANNLSTVCQVGGNNNQETARGDYNMSNKLRMFGRFSRWHSQANPCAPMGNGNYANDPYSPEEFTTTQGVLGVTYLISPTLIFDVRASYVRFPYQRLESFANIDESKTFDLPSYMDTLLPVVHGGPGTAVPSVGIAGYTVPSGLHIISTEDSYLLAPSLSWVKGKHTFKFGSDWRDQQNGYYQNFDGGSLSTAINGTCANALNCGASGNGMASMLLGFGSAYSVSAFSFPWQSIHYQGYYVQDTWQAAPRLTVTLGLRYEIPGVYTERYNRNASINPNEVNSALAADGITLNGQPIMGNVDFVNTPAHPQAGNAREHFKLFSPRLGLAYRLNDKTVIRAAGGIYYLPPTTYFSNAPFGQSINQFVTNGVASVDGGVTLTNPISNPFPTGILQTPANYSHAVGEAEMLGGSLGGMTLANLRYPYQEQANIAVQRQLPGGAAVEAAYVFSAGKHLPGPGSNLNVNVLPQADLALGNALTSLVPNPFASVVTTGALSQPTVQLQQLLLPFPEYTGFSEANVDIGVSTYNALQTKFEKRFKQGGTLLASYTFSKLMADVSTLTTWLNGGLGPTPGVQNPYNIAAEKSLSGFDARSRLTISYALDLPFGPGHKFLSGGPGIEKKLVGGWTVSGISTFGDGFPLALTATGTAIGTGYGRRPNVVPGCNPELGGPIQKRLFGYFNTACFTVPAAYTLGGESSTDPVLRGPGINNFDASLGKKTAITEHVNLQFRAEIYNLFNRVQFSQPNTSITTAANPTTGWITAQQNQPRLIQLSGRLVF